MKQLKILEYFLTLIIHSPYLNFLLFQIKSLFSSESFKCLSFGAEGEWKKMSPLVSSVRLVEALDEYRKNGLNYFPIHKL